MSANPFNSTKPHNLFVGRAALLEELIDGFNDGRSYAVLGGRRCGKTSLLLELQERLGSGNLLPSFGAIPRYLDMQALNQTSAEELFEQIYGLAVGGLPAAEWKTSPPGKEYQNFLRHFAEASDLLRANYGPKWLVVLLIDELDSAIDRLPNDTFFQNLRNLLMVSKFNSNFRLVGTGVADLTKLISSGSSPLNNLIRKTIGIMPTKEAKELLQQGLGHDLEPQIESLVLELTGRHPYLIQALFEGMDVRGEIDLSAIESSTRKFLRGSATFDRWVESFGNFERMIYRMISGTPEGEISIADLRMRLDASARREHRNALAVLSFHGVIDDTDPNVARISGTMFREWFREQLGDDTVQTAEGLDKEPTPAPPQRNQVFVSYSHKDRKWLEKLQMMLKPLVRKQSILVWDDTNIDAGAKWRQEIQAALATAKVAVLLVSPHFLASDFIAENELPPILGAAAKEGLVVLWVYISSCLYDETEIKDYQAAHDVAKPLDSLPASEQKEVLTAICRKIKTAAI